ncbi:MAG: DNA-processing protein DprA [Candidatus Paceibacterota bacterium]
MPPITLLSQKEIPERLLHVHPIPKELYLCGTLPILENFKTLAVVGARKHSVYGMEVCKKLIEGLSGYPIIIVSGLALGIDSISHQAALDANLLTIAVPGSGLDEKIIYPQSKLSLAKKILKSGGCLLSEYSPDAKAEPWFFPQRNRIMAGLADAVLIIEAEKKSGTLITARLALDYNKEVFAVPGNIFSPLSTGPHFLIKQGATPVTTSQDIVEGLGLVWREEGGESKNTSATLTLFNECSPEEKEFLSLLPSTRDEIIRTLKKPAQHVAMTISLLELKGLIKEEFGKIKTV